MALQATDFTCDVIRPHALRIADMAAWRALCAGHPAYGSPLFQPCFSIIAAQNRTDVRFAFYRRAGKLVGVLPFHLRPSRFARPVGAPFADFCGPVLAPDSGLTPALILELADLRAYKFDGLVDPQGVFADLPLYADEAYQIDLTGMHAEDYLETCRAAHAKRFKNFRRQINQLERDGIKLELTGGRPDDADFRLLSDWKSAQFQRTGRIDLINKQVTASLLETASRYASEEVSGYMVGLRGNGELLAGHVGLRSGTRFHPWIAAYRPDFAHNSPGSMILYKAITKMPEFGLQVYELAGGHDHYKKYFARNRQATLSGTLQLVRKGGVQLVEATFSSGEDSSVAARLRRRLDHIAVCETRPLVRIADIANALISAPRSRSAPHQH